MKKLERNITEDIKNSPVLKQKLLQAKKDILEGRIYSTKDVAEMIDRGEL